MTGAVAAGGDTVREMDDEVAVHDPFEALTTNEYEPAAVGVPDSTPETLFNVSPAGNAPESIDHVGAGVPDAVKV